MTGKFEIDAVLDVCGVPWRRGLRLSALRGPGPKRNENPRMAVGHTCHVTGRESMWRGSMWRGAARGGFQTRSKVRYCVLSFDVRANARQG